MDSVIAMDRRRLEYIENLLRQAGLTETVARARAQILFRAFFGYACRTSRCRPKSNGRSSTNFCGSSLTSLAEQESA